MLNSTRNLNRLYNVIHRSLFTINGRLSYDRITDGIIRLAVMVQETETDDFTLTDIGENTECCLSDLIVGAYWHYSHWHGGQNSKGYKALSELSGIYSPGMESEPETESGEYSGFHMLNILATANNSRIFDNGGESIDRYTCFPYLNSDSVRERVMHLGFSEGGLSVSMWGEINPDDMANLSFLGKEISFSDLSPENQNHVINRIQ